MVNVCVAPPLPSYPSGFQQLPAELLRRVVEGELLAAEMIDRWVALQVEEQVVVEANFLGFFLRRSGPPRKRKERGREKGRSESETRFSVFLKAQ